MKPREKILAAATAVVAVLLVSYVAVQRAFLMPAEQRFARAEELLRQIEQARAEKEKEPSYRLRLKELAGRAFGTDPLQVSERVRARIGDLVAATGLDNEHLTLRPVTGARVPGVYREVGWLVQVRGSLRKVVDFLYLLTREPHLHRLDNLVISPVRGSNEVDVQAKYGTLVLEPALVAGLKTDTVQAGDVRAALEAPDRRAYDLIEARALFRPYVPAPRREGGPPRPPPSTPRPEPPPSAPPSGRLQVVSLSDLGGGPEVVVRETATGRLLRYKPGDALAGGTVVAVDYRPLPLPEKPEILSGSRVVLRIDSAYYAVELGRYLEQKYRLGPDRLPPGLPPLAPPGEAEGSEADSAPSREAGGGAPPAPDEAADGAAPSGSEAEARGGAPAPDSKGTAAGSPAAEP